MLNLEKVNRSLYNVSYGPNKKHIGIIYMEDDGYFVFQPDSTNTGFFSEYSLSLLLSKLKELNKEWDDYLKDNFL